MRLGAIILVILISLFLGTDAEARSGCCSWHGGVSYCDTSIGTYVCNDGTYSPTCGCYYSPPAIPSPTPVLIPNTIRGSVAPQFNAVSGQYDVVADWDDINDASGYSVALSKYAGGDPGPIVDTYSSNKVFTGITPGKWNLNLKAKIGGGWSGNTLYWTLTVPPLPTPTRIPTSTPFPTPTTKVDEETGVDQTNPLPSTLGISDSSNIGESVRSKILNWMRTHLDF